MTTDQLRALRALADATAATDPALGAAWADVFDDGPYEACHPAGEPLADHPGPGPEPPADEAGDWDGYWQDRAAHADREAAHASHLTWHRLRGRQGHLRPDGAFAAHARLVALGLVNHGDPGRPFAAGVEYQHLADAKGVDL